MSELDQKGRCCGRKPLKYTGKRYTSRQWFCPRCDKAFDLDTNKQIQNFAWTEKAPGIFEESDSRKAAIAFKATREVIAKLG